MDHPILSQIASSLRRCGVTRGQKLLLAVSGGRDSVAILRALAVLAPTRPWQLELVVGHVQHHLREDAEDDAEFVAALAKELDLELMRADLDLSEARNVEDAARRQRYDALAVMARACGAQHIVTAHHADDQLETLLMRMLRGSSVRGMRGIARKRRLKGTPSVTIVRPLLELAGEQLEHFLNDIGQSWRTDHTNEDMTRRRAFLRHAVIPNMKQHWPDSPQRAAHLAQHMRQMSRLLDDAVTSAADHVTRKPDGVLTLDRTYARTLPTVVLTGLLRRLLTQLGAGADRLGRRAIGPMMRAMADHHGGVRHFAFSNGVRAEVAAHTVTLIGERA